MGSLFDVFEDLVGVATVFPHANLEIEVLAITIDEVRVARRRSPGYLVVDRALGEVRGTCRPEPCRGPLGALARRTLGFKNRFQPGLLAERLDRPLWFAQRVAYCLRLSGAARVVGKTGNLVLYTRALSPIKLSSDDGAQSLRP